MSPKCSSQPQTTDTARVPEEEVAEGSSLRDQDLEEELEAAYLQQEVCGTGSALVQHCFGSHFTSFLRQELERRLKEDERKLLQDEAAYSQP